MLYRAVNHTPLPSIAERKGHGGAPPRTVIGKYNLGLPLSKFIDIYFHASYLL